MLTATGLRGFTALSFLLYATAARSLRTLLSNWGASRISVVVLSSSSGEACRGRLPPWCGSSGGDSCAGGGVGCRDPAGGVRAPPWFRGSVARPLPFRCAVSRGRLRGAPPCAVFGGSGRARPLLWPPCEVGQDAARVPSRWVSSDSSCGRPWAARGIAGWFGRRALLLRRAPGLLARGSAPPESPTPILAAEARWPLGLWPKKFMRSSCGWPWAAWPAGRFGRRVSLSRRAPRIVPISRSARGGPGPLGRSRHRPESRVDPNQCKGNREVAGLVLLAPGSVPTPSQVPSELRPARGQPQDGRVDVLWSPESVPTPSRVPCEPEPVRGQPEVGRFDVPGCGPRRSGPHWAP